VRPRAVLATVALVVFAGYGVIVGGLYFFQRSLLYVPDRARPSAAATGIAGLSEVTLATADGLQLLAWYVAPPPGRPLIVYFHGNGGSIAGRSERVRRFAREGLGMLLLEYRGYGGNPGTPTEAGLFADARAALYFAQSQGVEGGRLVLWGESLGTGVAVAMASERRVAAVILESPYTTLAAAAQRAYPFVPVDFLLKDRFDSLSRIAHIHAPLLVAHGERDTVVPTDLGRALFAAAHEPKESWFAPLGTHTDLSQHGLLDIALGFIKRWVKPM
jgi:fermentation-respiration switch protein FrsA (DUF1100 family)